MKIILSRKGFDSSSGGYPSPILPDGTLLSLPIPDQDSGKAYHNLAFNHQSYMDVMHSFKDKVKVNNQWTSLDESTYCHLDPDLHENTIRRKSGWKGIFGQSGAAQRHLENQGVEEGDLFLFFGWFRNTILQGDQLKFDPADQRGRHIIYGYLQVGEIHQVHPSTVVQDWMEDHPHVTPSKRKKERNTIYIARNTLDWNEKRAGYGTFHYDEGYVLTKKGMNKSCWDLPECFKDRPISYHKPTSWKEDYFQSVARGQEFVIDANHSILRWAKKLIQK